MIFILFTTFCWAIVRRRYIFYHARYRKCSPSFLSFGCRSRALNLLYYGLLGGRELLQRTYKNLDQRVRLEVRRINAFLFGTVLFSDPVRRKCTARSFGGISYDLMLIVSIVWVNYQRFGEDLNFEIISQITTKFHRYKRVLRSSFRVWIKLSNIYLSCVGFPNLSSNHMRIFKLLLFFPDHPGYQVARCMMYFTVVNLCRLFVICSAMDTKLTFQAFKELWS